MKLLTFQATGTTLTHDLWLKQWYLIVFQDHGFQILSANTGKNQGFERELLNSGKVKFVASKTQREEIREERADQQKFAENAKEFFKEKAADFMLQGTINSILDKLGGKTVRYYQIELELINIETNEKVWIGQKKIKKLVKRSKFGL